MELSHVIKNYDYKLSYDGIEVKIVRFVHCAYDGGIFAPRHAHKNYEFCFIKKGKGIVNIEGREFEATAGDIYFIKPFVSHTEFSSYDDPLDAYGIECSLKFDFESGTALDKFELLMLQETAGKIHYAPYFDDVGIIKNIERIDDVIKEEDFGYRLISKILIFEVLVSTLKLFSKDSVIKYPRYAIDNNDRRAVTIKNLVDANMCNKITIQDASKILFLSTRHINRILLDKYGMTFSQYILNLRINTAKELLISSDMTIADVAAQAGFNSYQQMYRSFMSLMSISPDEYRKKGLIERDNTIEPLRLPVLEDSGGKEIFNNARVEGEMT